MGIIYSKYGKILYESSDLEIKETIEHCVKNNIFLFNPDFSKLDLNGIDLSNARFLGATFENCNLQNATLNTSALSHSKFNNSNLKNTKFNESNLTHCCFNYADLTNSNFSEANLTSSSLTRARIENTNWNKAILYLQNWDDVVIDISLLKGAFIDKLTTIKLRLQHLIGILKIRLDNYQTHAPVDILNEIEHNIIICNFSDDTIVNRDDFEIEEDIRAYEEFLSKIYLKINLLKLKLEEDLSINYRLEIYAIYQELYGFEEKLKMWHEKYDRPAKRNNLNNWIDEETQVMNALKNGMGDNHGF
jgi:uncharacterized protein YjbI with pentapeptide repeats